VEGEGYKRRGREGRRGEEKRLIHDFLVFLSIHAKPH